VTEGEAAVTESRQAVLAAVRKRLAAEPDRVLPALQVIADPDVLIDPGDDATVSLARTLNAHRIVALLRELRASSYSTEQVRELLGGVSRQAVSQRVRNRRLLAIDISGRSWFPDWQFVDGRLVDGLAEVLAALAEAGKQPLAANSVMRTPLPEEDGRTPGDLLAAGDVAAAVHYVRAVGGGF
jgi:hypothetical protein